MIKTHALSKILDVQNQFQNCPFTLEQTTLNREVSNLHQFFQGQKLPGQRSKDSHFTLNCIPTPLRIVSRGLTLRQIHIFAEVKITSCLNYISTSLILVLRGLNVIETHALSQILGVQNQTQNSQLCSIEKGTLTKEVCNFVPVFSRLEVGRAKVKWFSFYPKLHS